MTQRRSTSDSLDRVVRIKARLRDKATEINITLGDPASAPVCIQVRDAADPATVVHRLTGKAAAFSVDRSHLDDMHESMSAIRSPMHLPGGDRPNGIRLSREETIGGKRYPKGAVLIVDGVHRVAAAWQLGWRTIPARVANGTAEDVALLAAVSNTKAVRSARSPADIKNKMLLFKGAHGRLPTVAETAELCRASKRTVYRARRQYAEELGIEPREQEGPKVHHGSPLLTGTQMRRLQAALKELAGDPKADCVTAAALLVAALLDADDRRQALIASSIWGAVQQHLDPVDPGF